MPQIVGILNITPDSFSGDGGLDFREIAVRLQAMLQEGADSVDIGAESTRPGATPLTWEEEWQRLAPVMDYVLQYQDNAGWSVDTRHSETALHFIRSFPPSCHSRLYINDVSGGRDAGLVEAALTYGTKLVLTHSLTVPADKHITLPPESDVMEVVCHWGREAIRTYGNNVILDPGIGFGKTARQSWKIIKSIDRMMVLGAPIMVGHSRKSFLGEFSTAGAEERDNETLLVSQFLTGKKVDYLRVHAVGKHVSMLKMHHYLSGAETGQNHESLIL